MEELNKEKKDLQDTIKEKTVGYIIAGLGLVVGLAWNEAIKSFIEYLFPLNKNTVTAKFIYAFILTVLIVLLTTYLAKILKNKETN